MISCTLKRLAAGVLVMMATELNPGAPTPHAKYSDNSNTMAVQRFSNSLLVYHQQLLSLPPQPIIFMPSSFFYIYNEPAYYYYYSTTTTRTRTASNDDELQLQPVRKNKRRPPRVKAHRQSRKRQEAQGRCCWVPRSTAANVQVLYFRFAGNTTVMIKNVPNKLTRSCFMTILDDICLQQNRTMEVEKAEQGCAYNFLYLPIDFRTGCNRGYGFVNFTNAEGAVKVCATMHGRTWRSNPSKKICDVSLAYIQGKTELIKHFKNVCYQCNNPDYMPVVLHPPRDGSSATPATVSTIGILAGFGSMQ